MKAFYFLIFFLGYSYPCVVFSADWKTEEEAQQVAEQVVNLAINSDKTATFVEKTATLQSSMATLVMRATDLAGKEAQIAANQAGLGDEASRLAESLARLNAEETDNELRIRLEAAVLFAFDKAELRPDALQKLNDVLTVITGYPDFPVFIEGHTCSMGSDEYNRKLSIRRATSVRSWLVNAGIKKDRLSATGHGETQPVADNQTEEGRMHNRRVELVMKKN